VFFFRAKWANLITKSTVSVETFVFQIKCNLTDEGYWEFALPANHLAYSRGIQYRITASTISPLHTIWEG
jgi:hypothetical protein